MLRKESLVHFTLYDFTEKGIAITQSQQRNKDSTDGSYLHPSSIYINAHKNVSAESKIQYPATLQTTLVISKNTLNIKPKSSIAPWVNTINENRQINRDKSNSKFKELVILIVTVLFFMMQCLLSIFMAYNSRRQNCFGITSIMCYVHGSITLIVLLLILGIRVMYRGRQLNMWLFAKAYTCIFMLLLIATLIVIISMEVNVNKYNDSLNTDCSNRMITLTKINVLLVTVQIILVLINGQLLTVTTQCTDV